eukprot:373877_1
MADVTMMRRLYHCKADLKSQRYESIQQIDAKYIARMNQLLQQKSIIIKHIHQQYERQLGRVDIIIQNKLLNYNPATVSPGTTTMPQLEPEPIEANDQHQNARNDSNNTKQQTSPHRIKLESQLTSNPTQANLEDNNSLESDDGNCSEDENKSVDGSSSDDENSTESDHPMSKTKSQPSKNIKRKRKEHECNECDFTTGNKREYDRHVKTHKTKCNLCEYSCQFVYELKEHMKKHPKYKCDFCEFGCWRLNDLKSHVGNHKHKCNQCKYECRYAYELKEHMKEHMDKQRNARYKCNHCKFATKWKADYNKHIKNHKYKCDQCSFSCKFRYKLVAHSAKHIGEKPYQCRKCKKRFSNLLRLNGHVKKCKT